MKIAREILIRNQNCLNYIDLIVNSILQEIKFPYFCFYRNATFKNICIITGRTRWVIKSIKNSRFIFRRLVDNYNLEGWNRGSW